MQSITKILMSLFIIGIITTFNSIDTYAKENQNVPTEGAPSDKFNEETMNIRNKITIQSLQYLQEGQSNIQQNGTSVIVSGSTYSSSPVDTIAVSLSLQRWDSNKGMWVTVIDIGEFKDYYTSSINRNVQVNAAPGYYYRTMSHHWVIEQGYREDEYSVSNHIHVQ